MKIMIEVIKCFFFLCCNAAHHKHTVKEYKVFSLVFFAQKMRVHVSSPKYTFVVLH